MSSVLTSETDQIELALKYQYGIGVPRNLDEAIRRYQMVQTNPWAQHNLGMIHLKGYGKYRDFVRGYRLIQVSAETGYIFAQIRMGTLYYKGNYIPKDDTKALIWWNLATKNDSIKHQCYANYRLGKYYLNQKDYHRAEQYFNLCVNTTLQNKLTHLGCIRDTIHNQLNTYVATHTDDGISTLHFPTGYLFFCNFIRYLLATPYNYNDPLFRTWISDELTAYFRTIDPTFDATIIDTWFVDLFGE
jgi:TPR repeat protein